MKRALEEKKEGCSCCSTVVLVRNTYLMLPAETAQLPEDYVTNFNLRLPSVSGHILEQWEASGKSKNSAYKITDTQHPTDVWGNISTNKDKCKDHWPQWETDV